jgi:hypothetical protein
MRVQFSLWTQDIKSVKCIDRSLIASCIVKLCIDLPRGNSSNVWNGKGTSWCHVFVCFAFSVQSTWRNPEAQAPALSEPPASSQAEDIPTHTSACRTPGGAHISVREGPWGAGTQRDSKVFPESIQGVLSLNHKQLWRPSPTQYLTIPTLAQKDMSKIIFTHTFTTKSPSHILTHAHIHSLILNHIHTFPCMLSHSHAHKFTFTHFHFFFFLQKNFSFLIYWIYFFHFKSDVYTHFSLIDLQTFTFIKHLSNTL